MPELIIYLLKVNIALVIFYLAYRFTLRRLTFYSLNRFFLLGGIIFSSAYPFVDVAGLFRKSPELHKITVIVPDWRLVQEAALPQQHLDFWQVLVLLFWTGVFIMLGRLCIQILSLYRIHQGSSPAEYNEQVYRRINGNVNPFSFWQSIYINPDRHRMEEMASIIQHEQVHVKEWHTLDLLLAELSIMFYWFNPGVWLIKEAVRENLEFITDRKVLQSGMDSKTYQYSLLSVGNLSNSYVMANNFNLQDIKKRIMMMNKEESSQIHISRYVLVLPLIILLTFIVTVSRAQLEEKPAKTLTTLHQVIESAQQAGNEISGLLSSPDLRPAVYNLPEVVINSLKAASILPQDSLTINNLQTLQSAESLFGTDTIKFKPFAGLSGTFSAEYKTFKNSELSKTLSYSTHTPIVSNNALNVSVANLTRPMVQSIVLDGSRIFSSNALVESVATTYGRAYAARPVSNLQSNPVNNAITVVGRPMLRGDTTKNQITVRSKGKPLYIIDGTPQSEANFNKLNVNDIKSVSIMKEGAAAIYGEAAVDGAVLVVTWKQAYGRVPEIKAGNKLIFIDGKEASPQEIQNLTGDKIKQVNVITDEKELSEFGEKGKAGVIQIKTK